MKIGILVSMINNFGEKGFYNSQEIGMGKALSKLGHDVIVYKLLKNDSELPENFKGDRLFVQYSRVKSIGINGLVNTNVLDKELDALLFFSDTQLSVPTVYNWCKKNNVVYIPYIGVVESHSPSKLKQILINALFHRNISVFKRCTCLVKNSDVQNKLMQRGVKNIKVAPVGIDLDLLNANFENTDVMRLKEKYGYDKSDKVLLFIGRLEEEKRPLDLIEYFEKLYQNDSNYKLLIVGKGRLYQPMMEAIERKELQCAVKYIEKVPNNQIWELYRLSECFLNLNAQEIFGMVLLEAMYYKTKVIAWHAPGPDYIIENGVSGYLVSNEEELFAAIKNQENVIKDNAYNRIVNYMTWDNTAKVILSVAEG